MCGIVGYYGNKDSVPILMNGLKRLEYRGYDSAGIAVMGRNKINILKKAGKVKNLESLVDDTPLIGNIGIGHTRWATHGIPNNENAHPHLDSTGKIVLIHNGIIENYSVLKKYLENKGIIFKSQTDTEVLVQLIGDIYANESTSFEEAVQISLSKVIGTYGILVLCADEPEKMVAARLGSPLVLGLGQGEYFLGSDAAPIVEHTRNVIYLDEDEYLIIDPQGHHFKSLKSKAKIQKNIFKIEYDLEQIEKGNYPHFMLKEIHEQSRTIIDTLRGRLQLETGTVHLGGIQDHLSRIDNARRFYITACGTSWHAGLIGKYLLEEYSHIPVHVEYASEFRYGNPVIDGDTIVIAISQSGETADTMAAVAKAKKHGALTIGICNVVGSSISRETDCGIYTHAGPEIGVASTKAFTSQVTVLFMLALYFARKNGMTDREAIKIAKTFWQLGETVEKVLSNSEQIMRVAKDTMKAEHYLYLGRGMNFPVALEGALKLKEISYIHAEGYPAAEMKHGPIALIDENMPVVFLAPHDRTFDKVLSNIQEVNARGGIIIIVTDKKTEDLIALADYIIEIPVTNRVIFPILASIPLQLLAYHLAVLRGCDVDQPRNLAKSVTVE
ncbi:MAG: glutamine--fructose-6-phosphate transaminase (isomerizing) [Candidatus Neomarinimicrobiota bacterium]